MSENRFYVYGHYTADTNRLFYIGKGTGRRAWDRGKTDRNDYWHKTVNKHGIVVKLLIENLTEEDAFTKEKELIAEVGLDTLTNILEGGGTFTSADAQRLAQDPTWIEKVRRARQKQAQNPEWKEAVRQGVLRHLQNQTPEERAHLKHLAQLRSKDPIWRERNRLALEKRRNHPDWKYSIEKMKLGWKTSTKVATRIEESKKEFTIYGPDGTRYTAKGIRTFCRTHNLCYRQIKKVLNGTRRQYQGWVASPKNVPPTRYVQSPDGTIHTIKWGEASRFAKQHGLQQGGFHRLLTGVWTQYHGWTLVKTL